MNRSRTRAVAARDLVQILRRLKPAGAAGFEGLIRKLLARLTGYDFRLASAGYQSGRDLSATGALGIEVAVECKRFGESTELNRRYLLGGFIQATQSLKLDAWVLAASKRISLQVVDDLRPSAKEQGI